MLDYEGQRKYLTQAELRAFIAESKRREFDVKTFCWTIAATGCRISEALSLTPSSIDFEVGCIVIKSLKKRGKIIFRSIPIPEPLLQQFYAITKNKATNARFWPWSRMTGYRRICEVMEDAGISGAYATPKGLRHAFGVNAIQSGVPLNLVQRWLGHADIKTTAIYTSALGDEERAIAARMWNNKSGNPSPVADRATETEAQGWGRDTESEIAIAAHLPTSTQKMAPLNHPILGEPEMPLSSPRSLSTPSLPHRVHPGVTNPKNVPIRDSAGAQKSNPLQMTAFQLRQFWLFCNSLYPYYSNGYSDIDEPPFSFALTHVASIAGEHSTFIP